MTSMERHFTGKTILKKSNEILMWKAVRGSEDCQLRSSLRDTDCFIPLFEQLTMNTIGIRITKYSKVIVLMNQNLHSNLPLNTDKIQAIIIEPRSLP